MLYIMRHGKTDWNVRHKLQGRTDVPLNEEGRQMAEAVRSECDRIHFDVCYSSPLMRAYETAKIVLASRDIPIITDSRLAEMSFGDYEGTENSFEDPDCPINILFNSPELYRSSVGGAETFEELYARTGEFLREIIEPGLQEGRDILIVGHGAMNASIICQIKKLPIEDFWSAMTDNCRLTRLL
jgi:probable phosphoglycerate mutase